MGNQKQLSTKISKEVYADVLHPALKETGKTLALVPEAINAALAPLQIWIANREYNIAETKKLLEKKLESVGAENIVSPDPYVAVPALQAISYSMNSNELRNLYANLLAASMTEIQKENVHPAFVEIIKQLTPDEARILKYISENGNSLPVVDVKYQLDDGSYVPQIRNFTLIPDEVCANAHKVSAYLENLARLELITILTGVTYRDENLYAPLESSPFVASSMEQKSEGKGHMEFEHKVLEITTFGNEFISLCVHPVNQ